MADWKRILKHLNKAQDFMRTYYWNDSSIAKITPTELDIILEATNVSSNLEDDAWNIYHKHEDYKKSYKHFKRNIRHIIAQ